MNEEMIDTAAVSEIPPEASIEQADSVYGGSIYAKKSLWLLVVMIGILIVSSVCIWTEYRYGPDDSAGRMEYYPDPLYVPEEGVFSAVLPAETEAVFENGESYVIFDSRYQSVSGYTWQDLYSVLITLLETTPLSEGDEAVYCMPDKDGLEAPFFYSGVRRANGEMRFTIGLFSEGRYYELFAADREFLFDRASGAFYDPSSDMIYRYSPHVILGFRASDLSEEAFSFEALPFYKALPSEPVSVEQIETLVLRSEEGGGK